MHRRASSFHHSCLFPFCVFLWYLYFILWLIWNGWLLLYVLFSHFLFLLYNRWAVTPPQGLTDNLVFSMCIIGLHCCVCVCVCAETLLPIRMALCSPSRLLLSSPSICARKMVASGVGLLLMSHILPWSLQEEEEEKNPSIQVNFSLYSYIFTWCCSQAIQY